jgi:putative hydrolase of the HAD superfamily
MSNYRAVLFDIGGVLTVSPVTRIMEYCAEYGISDELRTQIFAGHEGTWSRFERSELTPAEFVAEFDRHLMEAGVDARGPHFMEWFFQGFQPRPEMIAVVQHLRGRLKLGAITNNVARNEPAQRRTAGLDVHSLFDVVVESAVVGVRKPEPRIYEIACEKLDVRPVEAVFLDDLGANLKGAKALGMATIKVDHTLSALYELEDVLGMELPKP